MPPATLVSEPHDAVSGVAIAVHGFTRRPSDLDMLARACAEQSLVVLRPGLSSFFWPHSTNNAAYLTQVAAELAVRVPAVPCVVVGHSAGAAAGSWLALQLRALGCDIRGVVYVDGVESPTGLIRRAWPIIGGLRVRALCAPPSRCNRQGRLYTWLGEQRGDVVREVVPGSGHGDIEGGSAAVYRWGCGDSSGPQVKAAVLSRTLTFIDEVLQ